MKNKKITFTNRELKKMLNSHKLWLHDEKGGMRIDLSNANLTGVNLSNVDLTDADLTGVNLRYANLTNADLRYIDLRYANLSNANLININLRYANLRYVDLINADLTDANLTGVDLTNADLRCANLTGIDLTNANLNNADLTNANLNNANLNNANLSNANLSNIKTNYHTLGYSLACPEEGNFIGYKKADKHLVKLLILEDSKRSSATTLKCRCDKAKVLDIENIETGEKVNEITSDYDKNFIYKVGEIVEVDNFNEDRWNECTTGIHFFLNKENAINYL